MKKILALGASSSQNSINKQFAYHAAHQLNDVEVTLIDLNDFEMPIFSVDREKVDGVPEAAQRFKDLIKASDGIILSLAEHNGSYTAAFKNLLDWTSRVEKGMWGGKPMFLLATSPGGRGGQTVLDLAITYFGYMDGKVVAHFSLPLFGQHFSADTGITDPELSAQFKAQLQLFAAS